MATITLAEQSFYYVMQLYNYGPFDRMCAPETAADLRPLPNQLESPPAVKRVRACIRVSRLTLSQILSTVCRFPRDPATGRKIFFYPSVESVDPAIIACALMQTSSNSMTSRIASTMLWHANFAYSYRGSEALC